MNYEVITDAAKEKNFCGVGVVIKRSQEVYNIHSTIYAGDFRVDQYELLSILIGLKHFLQLDLGEDSITTLTLTNDCESIIKILRGESLSIDPTIAKIKKEITLLLEEYELEDRVTYKWGALKLSHNLAHSEKMFYKTIRSKKK